MTPEEAKKYISQLNTEEKVRLGILLRVIETSRQNKEGADNAENENSPRSF